MWRLRTCLHRNLSRHEEEIPSELTRWPVQIRLVPPTAPFLNGAHLLVAADCTPVAYPRFHEDFIRDRVVLIGCPKFDDVTLYTKRFTHIFRTADIRSVTIIVMEVPCCQGLPAMVGEALKRAGVSVPCEVVTVGRSGEIIKKTPL